MSDDTASAPPALVIVEGYRPGLWGRVAQMHAISYSRAVGFGRRFEAVVAGGLAEFAERSHRPENAIWAAVRGETIVGAIAIDGEDLGAGVAHLRWFIVDDGLRGEGVGRKLLAAALTFVDAGAFGRTELWTFQGLDAARKLYERSGFVCVEERPGDRWGTHVLEQRFVRRRPEAMPETEI
jgi:GNAT superfamily N-acetyltransferase